MIAWASFFVASLCWLVVLASAALCPFLVATVIVELRELREVVGRIDDRPACRCRGAHPLFREREGIEND